MNNGGSVHTSEEGLHHPAEFGRAILQRASEGLCVCHAVAEFPFVRFTVWNEAMVRITGYSIDEINRRGWYQTVYSDPAIQARAMDRMARMRSGEDLVAEEWEITRADGTRCHVQIGTSVVPDGDGSAHVLAIIQDISARKRAEAAREALLFLEADMGAAQTPVEAARALFGVADRLWAWDSAFLNLCSADGALFDEVLNVDVIDGVRVEVPAIGLSRKTTAHMRRILTEGGRLIFREPGVTLDAEFSPYGDTARRSASLMFVPVRWHAQPVGILSVQSYTPAAFTQEDLRTLQGLADHGGGALRRIRAVEALRESELNLQRAQAVAQTGSWYADIPAGRLTWSAETCRIFGLPWDTSKTNAMFRECVHPEDRERVAAAWEAALQGAPYDVEHRIVVGEETKWVRERAEFSFDAQARPLRAIGTVQDVSERKRADARREQLEEQLRQAQKLECVGHLAGGVAHDFNNILASMVINLGLIREQIGPDPDLGELVGDMEKEARRAAGLVRQLLMFARRQVMTVRLVDLEVLLDNLLQGLRPLIGVDIELARIGSSAPSWIEADSTMIEQVITNLVLNARDALPAGGRIALRTDRILIDVPDVAQNPEARPGMFICLTVADTGVGMDPATQRRIFEPFFTTKGGGEGTGLGLSTVYGIVRQHYGWVDVESTLGHGSSFRVYLPAVALNRE